MAIYRGKMMELKQIGDIAIRLMLESVLFFGFVLAILVVYDLLEVIWRL